MPLKQARLKLSSPRMNKISLLNSKLSHSVCGKNGSSLSEMLFLEAAF